MPSSIAASEATGLEGLGFTREALAALAKTPSATFYSQSEREHAYDRFLALAAPGAKPGPFWKIDLDKLDFGAVRTYRKAQALIEISNDAAQAGVIACDLSEAKLTHAERFAAAFHSVVRADESKFVALASAFQSGGAFIYVPARVRLAEPIVISYAAGDAALFPHTLVVAGEGAHVTIIENVIAADAGAGFPVIGITEVRAAESARVTYAALQQLGPDATHIVTRRAAPARDAQVIWAVAELGAKLVLANVDCTLSAAGAASETYGLFFAAHGQHIDLTANVDHAVGMTTSHTHFKGAARSAGQARFRGNIRIDQGAHGAESSLREDALLLSKDAHIDSVPGLEIAANDVKAFHGATVGALDEEELFYVMARGIARDDAERLITLGFFEPVIAHFPAEPVRERIRGALTGAIA